MKINIEQISENLKKLTKLKDVKNLKLKQVVYPAVFALVAVLAIIFFAKTVGFLSTSINKTFRTEEDKNILTELNAADYEVVAKKLNIGVQDNAQTIVSQPPAPTSAATSTITPTAPLVSAPEKSALKIAVFNSTKTEGLAGALKNDLENAGFLVAKIGNQSKTENATLIKIRENIQQLVIGDEVAELVKKRYASAASETLNANSEYDIEIVIGKK